MQNFIDQFLSLCAIFSFLVDIEGGLEEALSKGHFHLKGGEAAEYVGLDQDPSKMDLNKMLEE
jgi:hypothetical protein